MGRVISDLGSFSETVANGDLLVCHNVSKGVNTRDEKLTVEKLLTDALGNRSVTITSGGNVGIGTTPRVKLEVFQSAASQLILSTGDGNANYRDWAFNVGGDAQGGLSIQVGPSAGTSPLGSANTKIFISRDGNITMSSLSGTGTRAVEATSTGLLQTAASDARMKTDVEEIGAADALAMVDALRPVRYRWNEENAPSRGEQVEVGLIAQEVRAHVPELVGANRDGMLSVDYARLTALLIGAVQALTARVEALEAAAA